MVRPSNSASEAESTVPSTVLHLVLLILSCGDPAAYFARTNSTIIWT